MAKLEQNEVSDEEGNQDDTVVSWFIKLDEFNFKSVGPRQRANGGLIGCDSGVNEVESHRELES